MKYDIKKAIRNALCNDIKIGKKKVYRVLPDEGVERNIILKNITIEDVLNEREEDIINYIRRELKKKKIKKRVIDLTERETTIYILKYIKENAMSF